MMVNDPVSFIPLKRPHQVRFSELPQVARKRPDPDFVQHIPLAGKVRALPAPAESFLDAAMPVFAPFFIPHPSLRQPAQVEFSLHAQQASPQ
jgi:hypothetical protein